MNRLERRYRWLLSWYPPEYRLAYEEEMVGVLMAGAQPQQQRPSWRESVNLAWNASLTRLGNRRRTVHDGRWHTASAVFGLLGALVLLTDQLGQAIAGHAWSDKYMNLFYSPVPQRWVIVGGWLVVIVCLLLGWRHSAALAAWFAALFQFVWLWSSGFVSSLHMHDEWWWQIGLTISVVVALSVATRSVKGASLIGGRWIAAIGAVALLGVGLELADVLLTEVVVSDDRSMITINPGLQLEWRVGIGLNWRDLLLAVFIAAAVAKLSAPLRRRVVAMFAPTVLLILLGWMVWGSFGALHHGAGPPPIFLLLAAVTVFLTSVLVVRLLDRREQRIAVNPVSSS